MNCHNKNNFQRLLLIIFWALTPLILSESHENCCILVTEIKKNLRDRGPQAKAHVNSERDRTWTWELIGACSISCSNNDSNNDNSNNVVTMITV